MSHFHAARSIDSDPDGIGARAAQHMERVFRTLTTGYGGEAEAGYFRWVTREAHPLGNVVFPSPDAGEGVVRAAIAPLLAENLPSAVLFPTGRSSQAADVLARAGFAEVDAIPAMAIDIARLAPTALPPGCAFVRVGAGSEGEAWAETLAVGYGIPQGLARRLSPAVIGADMAADAHAQFFAVIQGGRMVATSMLFLDDGLAGIYSVATLADARGKGIGAHVTAQALRAAMALGFRVGVLQSSQAGHSVYLRLGFSDVGRVPMMARVPAG